MSLSSFCKVFQRKAPLSGENLIKEFRKVENVDKHWEIPFRRRYLASKEDECRSIEKSLFMYGFTQWDFNTFLCGAFMGEGLMGAVNRCPIALIICFFAICCIMQLRMHRDKLTLHYSLLAFSSYIILMINLMILQPIYMRVYGGVTVCLAIAVVHFVILKLLGRFTFGRKFERFADSCLQFRVPTMVECHALLVGVIACLGIAFATVRLYYLAYLCLVVLVLTLFARVGLIPRLDYGAKPQDSSAIKQEEEEETGAGCSFLATCLPIVRSVICLLFGLLGLGVTIAALFDNHILSLRRQKAFLVWEGKYGLIGEFTFPFQALTYILAIALVLIIIIQSLFFLFLVLGSPWLRNTLQRQTIFMGKSCLDRKGGFYYAYNMYTVDNSGYVVDVDTLGKTRLEGYGISSITCYDIYLAMQRKALHALCQRTLYCHIPPLHLYTSENDSNILVRNRVRLERMANELDELIAYERERRRQARLERERLLRLQMAFSNRPQFISTSIPSGLEVTIPSNMVEDTFRDISENRGSYKRNFSIPVDLSLKEVEELPLVSKMRDRIYQRRCVTTSVTDDLYWGAPGIIDRVKCSWLEGSIFDPMLSGRTLRPGTARVSRDPAKGDFNFNKIDKALSNIFQDLEIMKPEGLEQQHDMDDRSASTFKSGSFTNINIGETPLSANVNVIPSKGPCRIDCGTPTPSQFVEQKMGINDPRFGLNEESLPISAVRHDIHIPIHEVANIASKLPSQGHYIDIDTTKSAMFTSNDEQKASKLHVPGQTPSQWNWLDNTVNEVLSSTTGFNNNDKGNESYVTQEPSWVKKDRADDISYERIRPIEEALEGQYYLNEKGQLVVKSGNTYVPLRYHGKRTVKKLAAFFSSPRNDAVRKPAEVAGDSESEDNSYDYDFSKIVSSPTHHSMFCPSPINIPERPPFTSLPSRYIILPEMGDDDVGVSPTVDKDPVKPETPSSQRTNPASDRPSFVLTREYEVHSPFDLKNVKTQDQSVIRKLSAITSLTPAGADRYSGTYMGVSDHSTPSGIVRGDDSTERATASSMGNRGSAVSDGSKGGTSMGMQADGEMSPTTLRLIAAAQHLPLALDSRHEKVYHVFPEARHNGYVMNGNRSDSLSPVGSVLRTPVSADLHRVNGSSGCDFNTRPANDDGSEAVTSPASSLSPRSPKAGTYRPVMPKQQWRNEFDFSPVAIHSAEDVMQELLQEADVADSVADDAGSDVSYDFIFGR